MCLFPKLILNPKYTKTKKNGGVIPPILHHETKYVPVGCGKCLECLKQKANEWRIRLHEELKCNNYAYFITLSFSPESLKELTKKCKNDDVNVIATHAIRLFTERYRKQYKKALRHWFITELGQEKSERIHIHGIIFSPFPINNNWLEQFWKYGQCDTGKYCNSRTINYIVKYVHKLDPKHKTYIPKICCSRGIGANYITNFARKKHEFKGKDTKEYYTLPNGQRVNLPIYYRNKLWDEGERETLWIHKVRKDTRYVNGIEIRHSSSHGYNTLLATLEQAQKENNTMGFGNPTWKKEQYKVTLKMLESKKKNTIY